MEIKVQNTVGGLSTGGLQKKQSREMTTGETSSTVAGGVPSKTSLLLFPEIKQRLLSEPAVDKARVARIAEAVQSGSYEINPKRVAEKLISMEGQLPDFS